MLMKTDYEPQDELIQLLESLGYGHEGFTRGYSKTSQARWMSVLDVTFNNENELVKSLIHSVSVTLKAQNTVELRLEVDEIDKFLKLMIHQECQGFTHPDPKSYFTNFKKHTAIRSNSFSLY